MYPAQFFGAGVDVVRACEKCLAANFQGLPPFDLRAHARPQGSQKEYIPSCPAPFSAQPWGP